MAIFGRLIIIIGLFIQQLVSAALAQDYPTRPIRIVNGQSPEIICRIFGKIFTDVLGQPVVVESIPGAGGRLAAEALSKSRPDGYTLLNVTASFMIFQAQDKGSGDLSKELLAGSYTFGITYEGAYNQNAWNISDNPAVVFQTANIRIQLEDALGTPVDGGIAKVYSGGSWKTPLHVEMSDKQFLS